MKITAVGVLKRIKERLYDMPCGHNYCHGPRKLEDMATCARCSAIYEINQFLKTHKGESK